MVANSFPFSVPTEAVSLYSGNLSPTVSMGMLRLLSFFDLDDVAFWTSSSCLRKKSGLAPAGLPHPMHNHLVVGDLESLQPFDVAHLDLVPRDVVNRAALVDEVMVPLDLRIEHNAVLSQRQRAQQSLLDEQVQRVVDRGARDVRHARFDTIPDDIGRGM